MEELAKAENWRKLDEDKQKTILVEVGLTRIEKGPVGNAEQVLASLGKVSLESWKTGTAALPQQFTGARRRADEIFEPTVQYLHLTSNILKSATDVDSWLEDARKKMVAKMKNGPLVIN